MNLHFSRRGRRYGIMRDSRLWNLARYGWRVLLAKILVDWRRRYVERQCGSGAACRPGAAAPFCRLPSSLRPWGLGNVHLVGSADGDTGILWDWQ